MNSVVKTLLVKVGVTLITSAVGMAVTKAAEDAFLKDDDQNNEVEPTESETTES